MPREIQEDSWRDTTLLFNEMYKKELEYTLLWNTKQDEYLLNFKTSISMLHSGICNSVIRGNDAKKRMKCMQSNSFVHHMKVTRR